MLKRDRSFRGGRRAWRRAVWLATGTTCLALTVGGAGRVATTTAAWLDSLSLTGTTLTAYVVPAPNGSTCNLVTPGTTSARGVILSWPAVVSPALSYSTAVDTLTSPSAVIGTSGSDQTLTVTYNPNTTANKNKTVMVTAAAYPTSAATWLSPTTTWKFKTGGNQNTQPTCGEAVAPVVVFTEPDDGDSTTRAAEISALGSACTNSSPACGTVTDASALTSTQFHFERNIAGTVTCWNTSWTAANCSTAYRNVTMAGSVWRLGGTATNAYGSAATYTLTIKSTDTWSNVTTTSITFTLT